MIKGTVQIDNKSVKYKFRVVEYSDIPNWGYSVLKYKTNGIFYNRMSIKQHLSIKWLINETEGMTEEEFEKEIIKYIVKDINNRKLKNKY